METSLKIIFAMAILQGKEDYDENEGTRLNGLIEDLEKLQRLRLESE